MQFKSTRARSLNVGDQIISMGGARFTKPMIVSFISAIQGDKVQIGFVMDDVAGVRTLGKRTTVEVVTGYASEEVRV